MWSRWRGLCPFSLSLLSASVPQSEVNAMREGTDQMAFCIFLEGFPKTGLLPLPENTTPLCQPDLPTQGKRQCISTGVSRGLQRRKHSARAVGRSSVVCTCLFHSCPPHFSFWRCRGCHWGYIRPAGRNRFGIPPIHQRQISPRFLSCRLVPVIRTREKCARLLSSSPPHRASFLSDLRVLSTFICRFVNV